MEIQTMIKDFSEKIKLQLKKGVKHKPPGHANLIDEHLKNC